MDQLELLNQKMFLGQEFLTWLWYLSEREAEPLTLADGRRVAVLLGESLTLGPVLGGEGSRVTVRGREAALAEAREALRQGKLVESLRLGLAVDDDEYWLTLKAAGLEISALRLPAGNPGEETEGEGPEGRLLERVFLLDNLIRVVEELFGQYLRGRLADEKGGGLWRELLAWSRRE